MSTINSPDIDASALSARAIENAESWVNKALAQPDRHGLGRGSDTIAAVVMAAAISYHADRQVQAAEIIASALLEVVGKGNGHG